MKKLLWLLIFCFAPYAYSQAGAVISGQIVNNGGVPQPYAQVRICPSTGAGIPCTPTASIYADAGLTTPLPNPTTTDANGFFSAFVGTTYQFYLVQTTTNTTTYAYYANGSYGTGVFCPLTGCTITGNLIVDGTLTQKGTASFGSAAQLTIDASGNLSTSGTVAAQKAVSGNVAVTAPNMQTGAKSGANPNMTATVNSAADTVATERHFFRLTDAGEWDAEGGYSPYFSDSTWASAGSGAAYLLKSFQGGVSQCNYTVQAWMWYTSTQVANYIGVTPNGTAAGQIPASYYAVGFNAGNFGFNSAATGWTTLVTAANLVTNNWYFVSLISVCSADGTAATAVVSYTRPGTITAGAWVEGAMPTATYNVIAESDSVDDIQKNVRFAAGAQLQPSTTVTPGTLNYQSINLPVSDTSQQVPWPLMLTVNSNPSGSSVNTYAYLPANYSPFRQHPWVFYSHGSGQSASQALFGYVGGNNYEPQVVKALVDAGYVVISTDESASTLQCWGNADCVADIGYMVQTYQATLNLAPRGYAICESMGGVVCWNAIAKGSLPTPLALVGIYPTWNLTNNYTYNSTLVYQLNAAYNCSSLSTCQANWVGYDPSADSISLFSGIPVDVWCSPNDTVVQCSQNGQAIVSAINNAGGSATYNASTGDHGDASNFDPSAVVQFLQSH